MNIEKPSHSIYKFYEISGMMVSPGSKHPYLVTFNMALFYIGMTYYWLVQFPTLFMENYRDKFSTIQYIVSVAHVIYKHVMVMALKNQVVDFISFLDQRWEIVQKNEIHRKIFDSYVKESIKPGNRFLYGCFLLNISTASIWMAFNFLVRKREDWTTWIDSWGVIDPKNHFWIFFALQFFSFQTIMISEGVSLPMVNYLCAQIAGHMRVLQHMLETRSPSEKSEYKETYKYHQNILKMVQLINTIYTHTYFVEMFFSSIQIAARAYGTLVLINKYGVGGFLFGHLLLGSLLIAAPYCMCWSCQLVKEEAEGIYRSAYDNRWYVENAKTNKGLIILTQFASKTLTINFKKFFVISLEQFGSFAQATYSYITMLKNVTF